MVLQVFTNVVMNETGDLAITASFAGNDKYYADEAIIGFIIKQATLIKVNPPFLLFTKTMLK